MDLDPARTLRFPDVPKLELDQLIDALVDRAQGVKKAQGRLRALLRAIETVTSDLSLDTVLTNIVEGAREITGAEYGAIGVMAPDGTQERFIHVGISDDVVARIGDYPEGRRLLGALITEPHPTRLTGIDSDGPAAGLADDHPPMGSFLGVPIHIRDEVFGNLYLINAAGGEFTDEDEELMTSLAMAAGSAISNARLYQESRLQQQWLQASAEIGTRLLTSPDDDPLVPIARSALHIAEADLVTIGVLAADHRTLVIEAASGEGAGRALGERYQLGDGMFVSAIAAGQSVVVGGHEIDRADFGVVAEVFEPGPTMVLPLVGTGDVRGTVSLMRRAGRPRFTEADRTMASGFASHASIALELADSRMAEQRLLLLEDRDRIAMDLHDHVIQELFAIGLGLESMATTLGMEHPVAERLVRRVDDVDRVIKRIRTSIFELRGAATSTTDGLRQRVLGIAAELRSALGFKPTITFAGPLDQRFDPSFLDDVVACVRESLTNVAKHAQSTSASVELACLGGMLTVQVTDDGVGPSEATRSSGTSNLRFRAGKRGGSYALEAAPGGGTIVTWRVAVPTDRID